MAAAPSRTSHRRVRPRWPAIPTATCSARAYPAGLDQVWTFSEGQTL